MQQRTKQNIVTAILIGMLGMWMAYLVVGSITGGGVMAWLAVVSTWLFGGSRTRANLAIGGVFGLFVIMVIASLLRRLGIPRPSPYRPSAGPPTNVTTANVSTAGTPSRTRSQINLLSRLDTGVFARYIPFGDKREVIVRRGSEMGHHYGLESSRRVVTLHGRDFPLVRSLAIISPPVLQPGQPQMSAEAAKRYTPQHEVLYLSDAEVLIRRDPDGFTDAEVETILASISFV